MSEYQYYEFQAIDRPLTPDEQAEIKKLSSRVQLTPNQAIFLYNYGDFRHKPETILAQYFDAMLYLANWGTWRLLFRLPSAITDMQSLQIYDLPDAITITPTNDHIILDININDEEGMSGWVEGEGWLPQLLPIRDELLAGDLRLLYLVWLRVAPDLSGYVLDEDPIEPPIPPNLDQLSPALAAFAELIELDLDLVNAAAQASARSATTTADSLASWLPALPEDERQEFLLKLLRREPHVDRQLINRLQKLADAGHAIPQPTTGQRRFSELLAIAQTIQEQREKREKELAKQKRIEELEALAPREAQTWQQVLDLIEVKQAQAYDRATALLQDLRDLAAHQGHLPEFMERFAQLKMDYSSRPALIKRWDKIK